MESVPWFILALLAIYLAFSRLKSVHLLFGDREESDADRLPSRCPKKLPPDSKRSSPTKKEQLEEKRERRH